MSPRKRSVQFMQFTAICTEVVKVLEPKRGEAGVILVGKDDLGNHIKVFPNGEFELIEEDGK